MKRGVCVVAFAFWFLSIFVSFHFIIAFHFISFPIFFFFNRKPNTLMLTSVLFCSCFHFFFYLAFFLCRFISLSFASCQSKTRRFIADLSFFYISITFLFFLRFLFYFSTILCHFISFFVPTCFFSVGNQPLLLLPYYFFIYFFVFFFHVFCLFFLRFFFFSSRGAAGTRRRFVRIGGGARGEEGREKPRHRMEHRRYLHDGLPEVTKRVS